MKTPRKSKILKPEPKNELIVQHNYLIEARYQLTLQEKRLMCWLASQVKPTDEDFKEHELSIKEFASLVEVKGDHLYKTLDTITHKLMQKIITIRYLKRKGFTRAALLGGVDYCDGQGIIRLSFHPYLKPYMLQIKERYTKIRLGDVMSLKSVHAIRVYELLKQYESIGHRTIPILDLRECCGIAADQYKKISHIKERVLEISKREINEKTDLLINYEEIKTSRKVTAIKFLIKPNPNYGLTEFEKAQSQKLITMAKELRSQNAILEQLIEYGFSKQGANRVLKTNPETDVANAIKAVDIQVQRGHVKNAKAMLAAAIKEKWHPEKYKTKKKAA